MEVHQPCVSPQPYQDGTDVIEAHAANSGLVDPFFGVLMYSDITTTTRRSTENERRLCEGRRRKPPLANQHPPLPIISLTPNPHRLTATEEVIASKKDTTMKLSTAFACACAVSGVAAFTTTSSTSPSSAAVSGRAFAPRSSKILSAAKISEELDLPCDDECALASYPNMPESVHPGVNTGQSMIDLLNHAKANGTLPCFPFRYLGGGGRRGRWTGGATANPADEARWSIVEPRGKGCRLGDVVVCK